MKQARAYSSALDQRDEQERVAQQARMRSQTIQSMQTKKYELDERKLGVSQPKTQYVSALPILNTVDSVVNPALKQNTPVTQGLRQTVQQYAPAPTLANMGVNNWLNQNNPVVNSVQTAMPNASLVQQATNNFQQWNKQYEQDEDRYIDAADRVSSLVAWGAPPDEEANRQLAESETKLNQTKEQQDAMLRQTLTMLGPGAEEIIKAAYKDATDRPGAGYNAQYTQEERERRAQNQKRAQELKKLIGADLYAKLYNYVYEQDTAAKAAKKQREEAEAAARRRHELEAKYYTLSSVSASKDFEEKSQYHSTAKDSQPSLMTRLIDNAVDGGTSDWDDPLYEAVNGNEEARAYMLTKATTRYGAEGNALGGLYGNVAEGKQEVKQMTEEEVGVFNYLYATEGKEVAHEYYDLLQELELNPRQRAEEEETFRQWANDGWGGAIGSSIFSVATSPLKVLSAAGQFADYITTGKIDENAPYNSFAYVPNTIRSTVAQKAEEKWGPVASFAYQTGMSMADFLYNSALTGAWAGEAALGEGAFKLASNMSLAIMGSGAAADATIEAKERGLTDKQAFVLGTVAGAAEILTEKFSIESLLTGKWEDSAIKFILKNAFVEGSEEVGSDVINMVADVLVAKDKSQWKQSIQAYRNSGLSEEEAFRRAMMDQALEMGLDYLGGSISGGVMAGIKAGMHAWGNRGYWQAQQAPRKTGSTDTNQSGFQTNTQVQTPQAVQQNQAEQAQANPFEIKRTPQVQETKAERVQLSERAQQLAQRMAALGEDGETAVELARDMEGYFWGDVTDEATVQRLVNNPAAESVMEWLLDQGERPGQTAAENVQSKQNNQSQQAQEEQLNEPIRSAMEQLDRQQRAANARNETERTGILAGAKTGQIEQAQRLGELVGREVAFFSEGKDASGGMRNGYYNQQDGRIYVNAQSQNPTAQIISHELTHSIEDNGYYTQLQQTVLKKLVEDGGNLDTLRAEKQALYERHGVKDVDVDAEIVAEYVEKNLLTDEESIRRLVQENRTLGQRIMEFIDKLLAKLGNKKAQEREFLSKARRYYADALAESQASGTFGQQERVRSMEKLREQMASGELTEEEAWQVFNEIYDAEADLQNGLRGNQYSYSPESTDVDVETSRKKQQFEIIQNSNAAEDDYHTWIRDASEIKTLSETLTDPEWAEYSEYDPDYTRQMAEDAIESGKIKVYSSYQIGDGTFVTPSRMEAESYSGNGRVYAKTVNVDDVAWIDPTQGQYAPVENIQYSISETDDGRAVAVVDDDILADIDVTTWDKTKKVQAKAAAKKALLEFRDGVLVNDVVNKVNKTSRNEFTGSESTEWLYRKNKEVFADKMRTADIADDVIKAATSWKRDGKLTHPRTDNFVDFVHGNVLVQAGNNQYNAKVVLGITDQGKYVFYDVTDMKPTSFQTRTEPSTAAASISTASAIKEDSAIDNIAEEAEFGKGKSSISEEENLSDLDRAQMAALESLKEDAQRAETEKLRQALPVKARQYLSRAERVLLANVQNALGVDKFSDKAGLMGTIQEISNEYLKHGKLTQERADALFEKAYKQGVVTEKEFYQRYKGIKDKLRTTAITLDEGYRSSIPDYRDFRQSAFGRLRLVNEGGMSVDSLYQELQQQAPELFPDSITNPADQLVQMFEVSKSIQISERTISESMGKDADEYKRWAKNDFESAVSDLASNLRSVSRYAQEQASKTQKMTAPTTPEEAMKAYGELKQARWTAEKAKAKNLLTDRDRMQVGRLLKGEIELGDLEAGKDNVQGIRAVYEASKEYDGLVKQLNQYKRQQRAKLQEKAQGYLKDALLWKDKLAGILYSREIMERNIRDIAPDKATADAVIREYFTPVHNAEAKSNRFQDAYRDRVREMDLSRKVQKGNKVSEAYAVQLLGEAEDNIRMIEKSKGRIQKRDGETAGAWRGIIETLRAENPNLDWTKVEGAVKEFRTIYDELFRQINEVRVRNGYEPINYRSGYFPHFQAQSDSILEQMGRAIGIDSQVETLPTSINGITGEFKPGIAWFKFGQQRTGYQTAYDAVEGFDKYIKSAADVIHHTDNIQNLRAFATEIRYMTGDEGMRKQMDAIRADQTLTEEEKRAKLEDLYKNGKFTLSNYVNELEEYTNNLANKKSKLDRGMEAMIGRRAYTIMKNFESRVGANMVAGNLASAFTNFIPLTQAGAQIDKASLLRGMWDTLKAYKRNDGFVDQSTFLTNRRGSDPIVQTWLSKASKVMGTPMEYIDNFTADSIVRARFRQNMRRGMSETLAMEEADSFAALVMADRSKGAQPTLFNATNPMVKAFTQFQLEVNNQFSEVFKDLPRAYKDKGLAALAAALLQYFFGAYLYNEVYEKIVGRRPALDPLGILNDTVGDLTGYELPNLVTMAGNTIQGKKTSFETEKVGFGEAGKNLTQNVLGELPFSSGLTLLGVDLDGGRIPASSAIPDLTALWDAATTEDWSGKKRWDETKKELNKLAYVIPPFGGNQIGKGVKTVKQLTKGGKYTVDADGNDVLQYPIDNTPGNWVRGMLFGPSSLPESQAYYNGDQKALTGEQTAVVKELTGQGVDQKVVYDLYQELRKIGKEKKGAEAGNAKRDAINALDLTDAQKLQVFAATMLDNKSEKYEETLGQYQAMMDAGLNWDEITQANNMYASLNADDDRKASEKARELELWIDDQDWTPEQEAAVKEKFKFWTMRQAGAAEGNDKYDYMQERLAGGTPPETVLMALSEKQQENYSKHLNQAKVSAEVYLDALNFASKAKTDEDGQTKKEKVVAYIDGLKLTRKQKRALYLCFYSKKDDTFK